MSSSSFDRAMAGPSKDDSDAKKDDGDAAQTAQSTKSLATTTTAVTSEEHAVESLSALTAHSVSLAAATATPSDERAATDVGLSVSQAADLSRRRVQIRREYIRSYRYRVVLGPGDPCTIYGGGGAHVTASPIVRRTRVNAPITRAQLSVVKDAFCAGSDGRVQRGKRPRDVACNLVGTPGQYPPGLAVRSAKTRLVAAKRGRPSKLDVEALQSYCAARSLALTDGTRSAFPEDTCSLSSAPTMPRRSWQRRSMSAYGMPRASPWRGTRTLRGTKSSSARQT